MLIYSGTRKSFCDDVNSGHIGKIIQKKFCQHNLWNENISELNAWQNSLGYMKTVLEVPEFSDDIQVAVEYQIPQTSKRVDFLIAGSDSEGRERVVVIELKQWTEAMQTSRDGVVNTFTGGSMKAVAHPSYQAYSYAKTIENFNATVQDENIGLFPCAYLHNYMPSRLGELTAPIYREIIEVSPLFIRNEEKKLRKFIQKYIRMPSARNLLYEIDNGKLRPSKALQDVISGMLAGNEEFVMIDEQKVVFEAVKDLVIDGQGSDEKYTVIVEGGPGTGKSVVAINLLAKLIRSNIPKVFYVTKNAAPRNVYFEKLKRGAMKYNYVKTLFKSSGAFVDSEANEFDCLIVDEAHRLNEKSGLFKNLGENQIKEIINAARVSVFFIDEDQVVTTSDIGSVAEIEKWAKVCGSTVIHNESTKLMSQFRCNGSDGYISFIDNLLGIRQTANYDGFDMEYDIQVFDDPKTMREALRVKNNINNKSRMIAGYCYEWRTKKLAESDVYDIELPGSFKAKWNFSTTSTWAIDADSFDQVGCIHTSQGLEFDYAGIIIGRDLRYEGGKVVTDVSKRAKTDQSVKGLKAHPDPGLADRIIRNTYKVLMTRGQKGCYVYCEDKALGEYLKERVKGIRKE